MIKLIYISNRCEQKKSFVKHPRDQKDHEIPQIGQGIYNLEEIRDAWYILHICDVISLIKLSMKNVFSKFLKAPISTREFHQHTHLRMPSAERISITK